ncbi:hypothetical protein BGX24_000504 [Mortierella sp. AD032]|nr:hypothetical protein BGX24_000504 [Mortierella sp. AD032]
MKIPPQTQFTDRFITITETEILLALKYYKHVSQHTIKHLNLNKLRSDRSPYIAHPGDLYHQLFVSDSVGYSRSGSLMHPDLLNQSSPKTLYLEFEADNKAYNAAKEGVVATTEMGVREVGEMELYARQSKTTKALLGDIREVLTEEDYQEVLIDERKFRLLSIKPGMKDTITPNVFDPRFPNRVKNITISQGLQLDLERK